MKRLIVLTLVVLIPLSGLAAQAKGQTVLKVKAIGRTTTVEALWRPFPALSIYRGADSGEDIVVNPAEARQEIDGFGGAFNEKGWEVLSRLSPRARDEVLKALFDTAEGAKLNIGRVPIGASPSALDRYTLNETPDDFEMKRFSIDRDRRLLIPYIQAAMRYRPDLKIWGSAWTPPTWMKTNGLFDGGAFRDEPKIRQAFALYLARFVEAYRREGVFVYAVAVQNAPSLETRSPSCVWRPDQVLGFVRDAMGPVFKRRDLKVEIMLGTMQDGEYGAYPRLVLSDPRAESFVSIVGFQGDGLKAVAETRERHPGKRIMQTETDGGNWPRRPEALNPDRPPNDWAYGSFTFKQIRAYFDAGVNSYMLSNMVLDEEGKNLDSERPWPQNAAVVADKKNSIVVYTPMYYAFKHFSYFVGAGARYLRAGGSFPGAVCFVNPSGEIILVLENELPDPVRLKIKVGEYWIYPSLPGRSFTTMVMPVVR